MLDFQAARWLLKGEVAGQAGNDHPTGIPTGVFPTSDGHINIAASSARLWERFCEAIGEPEWKNRPEWNTQQGRSANRRAINAAISEMTQTQPAATLDRSVRERRDTVRAHQHDRPRVCRPAGATSENGPAGRTSRGSGRNFSSPRPSTSPACPRTSARRPPKPAPTPMKCCAGSATRDAEIGRDARERSHQMIRDMPIGMMLSEIEEGVGLITFNQPRETQCHVGGDVGRAAARSWMSSSMTRGCARWC